MSTKVFSLIMTVFYVLFPTLIAQSLTMKASLDPAPAGITEPDRIHFLKTGSSDAILLESDGHFAMVDAGEDTDNPRGFASLNLDGYEKEVVAYLKAHAANAEGKVYLDFIVGTHAHSDHIGGFDTVILDPDITVGRAYLKTYNSSQIKDYEIEMWDNQEVYDQMVAALNERNVPIVSEPDGTPFTFGNFTVTLLNTDDPEGQTNVGENDQSLGVLLEKNGTKVFLAGDIDDYTGDETRLAPVIGKVDLLKVGHHSYTGSTTKTFVETLHPEACVITNTALSANRTTMARIIRTCRHKNIYITGCEDGVLAVIGDNGAISYYGQICDY